MRVHLPEKKEILARLGIFMSSPKVSLTEEEWFEQMETAHHGWKVARGEAQLAPVWKEICELSNYGEAGRSRLTGCGWRKLRCWCLNPEMGEFFVSVRNEAEQNRKTHKAHKKYALLLKLLDDAKWR